MDVTIEAGTIAFSREDRTVTGLLMPYGEVGRTTLGRFSIPRGAVSIPTDPAVVTLNDRHDYTEPIGRATALTDTDAGVVATFAIARTAEGDAYLADVEAGRRTSLSAEVKRLAVRSGQVIAGALFGAAACKSGAFPSATLLAADAGPEDEIEVDGVTYRRVTDPQTPTGTAPEDDAAPAAGSEAPVDDDETGTEVETDDEVLKAALPGSVGGKPAKGAGKTLFASLAGKTLNEAGLLLAALDNIVAADALPSQQQQWLGEIGNKKTYVRRFSPLIQHDDLQGLKAIGWQFEAGKAPTVGDYAGFPAQPTSTEVKTKAVTMDAARLAGAGAVDRAFLDFPTPEFWAGYFREFTNDYERKADAKARDAIIAGATALVGDAVPAGVATAFSYIVDGAAQILDSERGMPTFALVGTALWKAMLRTRAEDALAYLTAALGLEDGTLENFKIVPSSVATLVGKVVVGTKESATQFELPGSPTRVDTVNIATGGAERGVFGYHAEMVNDATGLVIVGPAEG